MYAIALFMQQIIYASENGQLDSDTKKDECSSSSDTASDTELNVENPLTQTKPRAEMTYIDLAVEFFCCNALFQGSSVQTIDLYKKGVLEAKNEEEFFNILENLRESCRQDESFKVFFAIQFTVANYANDEKKLECIRNVFEKTEKIECSESVCELMKVGLCEANTADEFLMVYKKLAAKLGPVHGLAVFRVINYTMAYYTKEETKIKNMLEALSKVRETDAIKTTLELFKNKACEANDDKTVFKELLADCKKKFSSKYGFYVFAAIDIVSDNYKKSELELLKILRGVIYLAIKKKKQGIMDMFFEELYEGSNIMQIHDICQKMNGCFRDEDDVDSVLCAMVFTIADKNPENMKKMIRALRKMELPNDFLCIDIEMTEENFFEKLYYFIGDYKLCDDSDQKTKIVQLIKENINVLMQVEQLDEQDKQKLEDNEKKLRKLAVDEEEYAVMLKFMSDSVSLISNAMDQIKPMETCYIGPLQNNKDCLKRKSELEDEYELVGSDETDTTVGSENKKKSIEEEYNERFSKFRVSNRIYSNYY